MGKSPFSRVLSDFREKFSLHASSGWIIAVACTVCMRVTECVQQFCLILAGAEYNFKVGLSSFFTLFLQKKDIAEQLTPLLPDGPREESLQFVSELKVGEQRGIVTVVAAALQDRV